MILTYSKIYKSRLLLINLIILISLGFVIFKNIDEIRFVKIVNEQGEAFILDRFTSKIKMVN
ncbi:MAG: hypothetical protein CFH34_01430 [Alphaproteobacteria bacterium MarineAlpha9_Bin4]|nr:hypothetical protein [Pelagibacterales bacterium]PPR25469.1 MAG: hypothetical protein CFH34_01430 [Alphaproteobacteria bacterium MarineAlpha9_Bin4]